MSNCKRCGVLEKQRRVAWAKFYEITDWYYEDMNKMYEMITKLKEENDYEFPSHIKNEMLEMYDDLKKKIECPICYENMNKDNLHITRCGHKICKECYKNVDKCPICRNTIYKK
jgi:hypothetical protein